MNWNVQNLDNNHKPYLVIVTIAFSSLPTQNQTIKSPK